MILIFFVFCCGSCATDVWTSLWFCTYFSRRPRIFPIIRWECLYIEQNSGLANYIDAWDFHCWCAMSELYKLNVIWHSYTRWHHCMGPSSTQTQVLCNSSHKVIYRGSSEWSSALCYNVAAPERPTKKLLLNPKKLFLFHYVSR